MVAAIHRVTAGKTHEERAGDGLQARIVGVALSSTIAALVLTFALYQWSNWTTDRRDLVKEQIAIGRIVAGVAQRALVESDPDEAAAAAALLEADEEAVSAVYFAESGARLDLGWPASDLAPGGGFVPSHDYRGEGLLVRVPHFEDGRRVGELVIRASDRPLVIARIRNIAIAAALSLIATLAAAIMARKLASRALRPVHVLNEAVESVTATQDFSRPVPVRGHDEVARLTRNFNQLLGALQIYDGSLRGMLAEVTEARDEAEEANRLKSQFLANMGHEVRTPLNGVMGMAQTLLRDRLTTSQRERVEVILSSGQALLCVLNDVLDLSQIESGTLRIDNAPFDLEAVIADACAAAVTLAESKGLRFRVEVDPAVAGGWSGDASRLRQVVFNLVANGLKFTAAGEVRVQVGPGAGGEGLSIAVIDTGIGIAPELMPRLFGKFVQGEAGATRRFGGAGLGLAICRSLVDLMGGDIIVDSKLGQGSTFLVELPLQRAKLDTEGREGMNAELGALRVLVAEDNETNQRVVRTVLNALGVDPVIVPDGRAAVEAWGRGEFDLVLMDIQMPIRDGVSATRDIRRLEAERGLPPTRIVALTANAMQHQVAEYAAAGMDGLVPKPIMVDKLHAALVGGAPLYAA